MDTVLPVVWFMRREMRSRRGALSLPRFRTLVRVDKGDGGVSAVAEHLGISVPTASRLLTGLVNQGYIARQGSGADRRRVGHVVTAKGREVLDAARAGTLARIETQVARLAPDEREAVSNAMDLLKSVFLPAMLPKCEAETESTVEIKRDLE